MARPKTRSLSVIMQELHSCVEERDRELAALRAEVLRLRRERDDLSGQLRFAVDQANRETRAAGSLRAELLARAGAAAERRPRATAPAERVDFCDGDHAETTAVLPRPTFTPRRRPRDDDTIRT